MDKEMSIPGFWAGAVVLGSLGFFAVRWRRWAVVPILLVIAVGAFASWSEWTDPSVGPAIRAEAGPWYGYHLVASVILACGLMIAGLARSKRST